MRRNSFLILIILIIGIQNSNIIGQELKFYKEIQTRLNELGFYSGKIDGIWGKGSVEAVKRFQTNDSLKVSGKLDEFTLQVMFPKDIRSDTIVDSIYTYKIFDILKSIREGYFKRMSEVFHAKLTVEEENPARIIFGDITDDPQKKYSSNLALDSAKITFTYRNESYAVQLIQGVVRVNTENEKYDILDKTMISVNDIKYKFINNIGWRRN